MSFCDSINWKFWSNWDLFGSKKIARLEKRIEELENEVMPKSQGFGSLFSRIWVNMYEFDDTPKSIPLRERVSLIQEHLKLEISREREHTVVKVKSKKK